MRTELTALILLSYSFAFINAAWAAIAMRRFLDRKTAIETQDDLTDFKKLVTFQMRAALLQIALAFVVPFSFFAYGFYTGILQFIDLAVVIVPALLILTLTRLLKLFERRIQGLTVTTDHQDEFAHVVHVWMKKPFPDW